MKFYKYHGTGNDFIMIDDRSQTFDVNQVKLIQSMCDRRYGIGADGLILLQSKEGYDFEMVYFNADGAQSSMCGNGGRCIVAFAKYLGVIKDECYFLAIDGPHDGKISSTGIVSLKMQDVSEIICDGDDAVLDTGSPHYVKKVHSLAAIDVEKEGRAIRNSERYQKDGINVNFVEEHADHLEVATYERGVEGETYSCGTGVVACSIAFGGPKSTTTKIKTKGGNLTVRYNYYDVKYHQIWLTGPAVQVYDGSFKL